MKVFILIFFFIGIILTAYLAMIFVHELVHLMILKEDNVGIDEFVILGYRNRNVLASESAVAWILPAGSYNATRHICWDRTWRLNFTCLT